MTVFSPDSTATDTAVIQVGRTLDYRTATEFKWLCQQQLSQGVNSFILDFSGTFALDSTGLGAIFSVYRQVNPQGGRIALASVTRPVEVVMELTKASRLFPQYETVAEASSSRT